MTWLLGVSLVGNVILGIVAVYYYIQLRMLKRDVTITKKDLEDLKGRVLRIIHAEERR